LCHKIIVTGCPYPHVHISYFKKNVGEESLVTLKGKGKAIPVQVCTDPEGSSRLRLPDFKTIGT